jgi:hypothetical protein
MTNQMGTDAAPLSDSGTEVAYDTSSFVPIAS